MQDFGVEKFVPHSFDFQLSFQRHPRVFAPGFGMIPFTRSGAGCCIDLLLHVVVTASFGWERIVVSVID